MAKKKSRIARGEISETLQKHDQDMTEKNEELDTTAADVETERHTLENLDFGGTAEGTDEVEQSIRAAEDATMEVFERQDQELEGIQAETEHFEDDLLERTGSAESDLGKIADADSRIKTPEGVNELAKATEGTQRDIDFLTEHNERAREARAESERTQEEQTTRVSRR